MQRIPGLSDPELHALEARAELAMAIALQQVMDTIADTIERRPVTAAAFALVAVGEGTDAGADIPQPLPPASAYLSPDDLAMITPLWEQAVATQLMPLVSQVFHDSSGRVYSQMVDASGIADLGRIGSPAAEAYLAQARATFDEVSGHLWETARTQMLEGFQQGESIPEVVERLRGSAELTARSATLVARTQIIEASNAGSYQSAAASGLDMQKEWIATPDLRTRPTHLAADGQKVDLNDFFQVGGYSAMFPAAGNLPPSERYNCRCTIGYVLPDRSITQAAHQAAQTDDLATLPGTSGQTLPLPAAPGPGGELAEEALPPPPPTVPIRPALLRATTPKGLQAAVRSEVKRITGRDVLVQIPPETAFGPVSMPTWRGFMEGILRSFERFPETRVREIGWFHIPSGDYAQTGGQAIRFNAWWGEVAQRQKLLRSLRSDASWAKGPGWFVRDGGTPESIGYHEFGHLLSVDNLGDRANSLVLSAVRRRAATEGIADDELIMRQIGAYATSDEYELIAEAFNDVMLHGDRAAAISRDIVNILEDAYRTRFVVVTPPPGAPAVLPAARGLAGRSVGELREIARGYGIDPTGVRKQTLIELIEDAQRVEARRAGVTAPAAVVDQAAADIVIENRIRAMYLQLVREAKLSDPYPLASGYRGAAAASRQRDLDEVLTLTRDAEGGARDWQGVYRPRAEALESLGYLRRTSSGDFTLTDKAREYFVPRPRYGQPALGIRIQQLRDALPDVPRADLDRVLVAMDRREGMSLFPDENQKLMDAVAGYRESAVKVGRKPYHFLEIRDPAGLRPLPLPAVPTGATAATDVAKMTLPQLRDLATTRGVDSAGASRTVLVDMLSDTGKRRWIGRVDAPAAELKRLNAVAEASGQAQVLTEVLELLESGASPRALASRIRAAAADRNGYGVGPQVTDEFRDKLLAAVESGDLDRVARELAEQGRIRFTSEAGRVAPFDRATMQAIGPDIPDGTMVTIVRPGAELAPARGAATQLYRARVQAASDAEIDAAVARLKAEQARETRRLARERNVLIEQAGATERLIAEIDQLVSLQAKSKVIAERLVPEAFTEGQPYFGADQQVVAALRTALASADPAKLRAALTRAGSQLQSKAKIKPIGKAGQKVKYDPVTMEPAPGVAGEIAEGTQVVIERRGATLVLPDGSTLTDPLTRAQVRVVKVAPKVAPVPDYLAGLARADIARVRKLAGTRSRLGRMTRRSDPVLTDLAPGSTPADLRWLLEYRAQHPGVIEHIASEQEISAEFAGWRRAAGIKGTPAQVKARVEEVMRQQLDGAVVEVRRGRESSLRDILERGRMRTQFETESSSGVYNPRIRAEFEESAFGYAHDLDPTLRPVYGYMSRPGIDESFWPVQQYGDIRIVLKPEVRERTSFTVSDSLGYYRTLPSPVEKPSWVSYNFEDHAPGRGSSGPRGATVPFGDEDWSRLDFQRDVRYVEAQIHGGVSVDDIAEVIFVQQPQQATIDALEAAGVPWRVQKYRPLGSSEG